VWAGAVAALLVVLAGFTPSLSAVRGPAGGVNPAPASTTPTEPGAPGAPGARVTASPADGATAVNPTAPVTLSVTGGTLKNVALTNAGGKVVQGALDPAASAYTTTEVLGYGNTYTWSGVVRSAAGAATPVTGSFTTVTPSRTASATLNIGDNRTVGIAAPIIVEFSSPITDKAAVQKLMAVTTNPPTVGSWAWLPDGAGGARAHWRPQNYWVPGTTVDVGLRLYGLQYASGVYAMSDLTSHFTIGRSQIVKADVTSYRMQVVRAGQTVMNIPVSYGAATESRNVTRSGIHVVTDTIENLYMTNPPYYENVLEHWSVRISNNGEFIHANPQSAASQGNANVTNGCVNLSTADAKAYFDTVLYGDPVEVTGSSVPLSASDGDVYDWAIPWADWQQLSASA